MSSKTIELYISGVLAIICLPGCQFVVFLCWRLNVGPTAAATKSRGAIRHYDDSCP